jgi:NAD(P)-dependent dehydrogenase (short-subunit alcohol dehydrogenase family)
MANPTERTALVTGANKGIGLETARQLAARGFTVLLGSRDERRGREAAASIRETPGQVEPVKLDVTSEADRKAVARLVAERFGRLDVLVNNAGVAESLSLKASTIDDESLRSTFEANFFGAVALTRELLPHLRKSDAGRIVNVSSQLGPLTRNAAGDFAGFALVAYNASKAALNMYTILLAQELHETPIKVNAAHPGWVKTDLGTDAAPLEVSEGAKTSVRLATLGTDGPTGGFFFMDDVHPW